MARIQRVPTRVGIYRVTAVTGAAARAPGESSADADMAPVVAHVTGTLAVDGEEPVPAEFDLRPGVDRPPDVGDELIAEVLRLRPVRARIAWGNPLTR